MTRQVVCRCICLRLWEDLFGGAKEITRLGPILLAPTCADRASHLHSGTLHLFNFHAAQHHSVTTLDLELYNSINVTESNTRNKQMNKQYRWLFMNKLLMCLISECIHVPRHLVCFAQKIFPRICFTIFCAVVAFQQNTGNQNSPLITLSLIGKRMTHVLELKFAWAS